MIDNKRIGRAIRTLREKAGYTQRELADILFVSDMAVSKWETGKSIPDVTTLKKMAVVLDMDIDGLLDGTASWLDDNWAGVLMTERRLDVILCDKPVADYVISYFLLAGIRKVYLFVEASQADYVLQRFRNGEYLGIQFLVNPTEIWETNLMLISEPVFLYGVDLTRFLQRAMHHPDSVVNLQTVVGNGNELPVSITDMSYYYRSVPFYFFRNRDFNPHRKLSEVLEEAKKNGCLIVEPMDKGFVFSDLIEGSVVKQVEMLIDCIQNLCGYLICCPLEIAWRRGIISTECMVKGSKSFPEYTDYIKSLGRNQNIRQR